ncbi:MAG: Hsp20/alpha crystallin family protein [Candidatus Hodarchaeota archaeon]
MFDRFWKDIDKYFEDFGKDFERAFKKSFKELSKDSKDSLTWGYRMYWDNSMEKPVVKYFGNFDPTTGKLLEEGWRIPPLEKKFDDKNNVWNLVVDLPGVKKENISLSATPAYINIEATSKKRKYKHKVDFDKEIDPESVKAKFNNGILKVTVIPKVPVKAEEKKISIE